MPKIEKREHVRYKCNCYELDAEDGPHYCMYCDGGLFTCIVCGGVEGSLTTECPGVEYYKEYGDRVYAGEIDFRGGKWVDGPSISSPAYYRDRSKK